MCPWFRQAAVNALVQATGPGSACIAKPGTKLREAREASAKGGSAAASPARPPRAAGDISTPTFRGDFSLSPFFFVELLRIFFRSANVDMTFRNIATFYYYLTTNIVESKVHAHCIHRSL